MALVDLHLHTTASDGRLTPTELVHLLARQGLQVAAITDHDSTEGLAEAYEAAEAYPQLTLIPGIEISTGIPGNEIHVLAYFIQYDDEDVQETLREFRQGRLHRAMGMVEKLRELGLKIEWQRVQEIAGDGAVGRPHVAQALLEGGYISEQKEAFTKYIGRNGPAYVERQKLTPREATELIIRWGGVPVLAHPSWVSDLEPTLEDLKQAGLAGMEVYYAKYFEELIQELGETASRHGLLACGGSDYHAVGNSGEPLPGSMGPPLEVVEKLATKRARAGQ